MRRKTPANALFLYFIFTAFLLQGCFQAAPENTFDLIIKEGKLYDGTSARPVVADIGIKGDKIAAIGQFTGKATKIIYARDLIVTPGFIDVGSHTDLALKEKGIWRVIAYLKPDIKGNHNYLRQGVTTIITGNSSKGYSSSAKWLGWVDSLKFGVNVYHLAPVGAIIQDIFTENEFKPQDEKQRNDLKKRLLREVENGAIGISLDLSQKPDQAFTTRELADIASCIRPYGGIVAVTLRNTSGAPDAKGNIPLITSLKEVVEIARLSHTPIEISDLKLTAPWKNLGYEQINSVIRNARKEGLDITADQSPYDSDFGTLTGLLPPEYVAGDYTIKKEYTTVEGKKIVIKTIENLFTRLGAERFFIISYAGKKSYEGKTIKQIAILEKEKPAECYWKMVTANPQPLVAISAINERFAKNIMSSHLVFTSSKGITYIKGTALPHPGNWGAFARKLRKYTIEERIMHFDDAIRSMTSLPAEKFKLSGRGRIAVGYFADIAIIDLKKFKDKATFLNPEQYAEGVEYLVVNGILSVEKGAVTTKKGGRALKRI